MASKTLGRIVCPISCGFDAAQVKVKTDKASGTAYPYIHCANCGCQLHTKSEEQAGYLLKKTRPEKLDTPPPSDPAPEQPPTTPEPSPPPPKAAGGFQWGFQ